LTAASVDALSEALHPLLVAAGWAPAAGWSLARRGDRQVSVDDRTLYMEEVNDESQGVVEVMHIVVSTVEQAIGHLRAAGALPPEPAQFEPALPHGGTSTVWIHDCGQVEHWPTDPGYLATEGPITGQGCDACESGGGTWTQLYVEAKPATRVAGQWRINCGVGRIPEGQGQYPTKRAAQDVMRLHSGSCPGSHAAEFVPEASTDE
jgi:hypothetical protein